MAPGSEPQATFREEDSRLVLANASFSLAFSRSARGAIVSLSHHRTGQEFIHASEAEDDDLWRIGLVSATGSVVTLSSRHCEHFAHTVTDPLGLTLTWSELHIGAAHLEGHVTAHFAFARDGRTLTADLQFDLPEGLSVAHVDFPRLCALGPTDPVADDTVFLPLAGGLLVPGPRALLARADHPWEADYPGPAALQLAGYSCGRLTVWLSTRDASGAHKTFAASGMPRSDRLALWVSHHPQSEDAGVWSIGYPTTVGLASGDWYEAAKDYRLWALRQPWCRRGAHRERTQPALTTYQGMWLTHRGGGGPANDAVQALLRHVNAPVRLDWRDWHGEPYPDCFPPRDGEEGFAAALRALSESGVYTQLTLDGLHASTHSVAWQNGLADVALSREIDGIAEVSPAPAWRTLLTDLAGQGTLRGAEGICLDYLVTARPRPCSPDSRTVWYEGVRAALESLRAKLGDSYQLAADGPAEPYLDLLDAFASYHPIADRLEGFDRFGSRWSPIPLFSAIYHEYSAAIALGPTLSGMLPVPEAPILPARDFSTQFCLEIARGMVWGWQLAMSHFHPELARDERNRRRLAFLAAALRAQTWGVGAVIAASEFLGMVPVQAPPLEADFLVGIGISRRPREAPHVVRRRISPVLGSAWRIPGGGNALVMANVHEHQVEFTASLNPHRMVLNLPLHIVGRTFSEDGDAPAATLRPSGTSGTDIGGRLPARSVLLVTLY